MNEQKNRIGQKIEYSEKDFGSQEVFLVLRTFFLRVNVADINDDAAK